MYLQEINFTALDSPPNMIVRHMLFYKGGIETKIKAFLMSEPL